MDHIELGVIAKCPTILCLFGNINVKIMFPFMWSQNIKMHTLSLIAHETRIVHVDQMNVY